MQNHLPILISNETNEINAIAFVRVRIGFVYAIDGIKGLWP
jgi:hypothetical protein